MRVLLTTDTIGGVWTFTRELATELLNRGHAVALVSFGRLPSASQTAWIAGVRLQHGECFLFTASDAPLEWMAGNEAAYTHALPCLLRVAQKFSPDLVHTSQFCFGSLPLRVPVVVTAHSDVMSWAAACRGEGLEPGAWLKQYRFLVERGLKAAHAVVAPTLWMLEALREHFSLGTSPHVILNGRSLHERTVRGAGIVTGRSLQAVSVGRFWDQAKGFELLTKVESTMPIHVAGEQEHGDATDGSRRLRLLGALDEADLLELFRGSSVYLAPSLYEPFGLAPLEAAQCGCAVLAKNIASLREVWGEAALYFEDATGLTGLLQKLHGSPDMLLRARKRSEARGRHLTGRRMADQYLALYGDLVRPEGSRRKTAFSKSLRMFSGTLFPEAIPLTRETGAHAG